jgi:ATP/maltotriose-dependent transcriptional regulator MalT
MHLLADAWAGKVDIETSHYVTGDTAFAVDKHGVIVLWNKAAESSLGFTANEALGQRCWKLLSGLDTNGNRHCCKKCPIREMSFKHEPVNTFQTLFNTASEKRKRFAISCLTVFDDPGSEMLLHLCRPKTESQNAVQKQVSMTPPTNGQLGALSQREIEVLTLLAEKVSTRDIAERMAISIRTVRTHIQHLMYKLQVHKRCEAIQVGKRLKLI